MPDLSVDLSLTAVLAADVAGYTRLMNEDAEGTLRTLRRLRGEVMDPVIAARRGRIVKNMGDGWIVTFRTVSDAVQCAMQLQDRLKNDDGLKIRIGVHLGDVAETDGDVFGEGVNVAARLQEIAEPGAVVVSDAVFGLLDGTLRPSFDDAGERALKNIAKPVRLWSRGGDVAGAAAALALPGFPRLTIQPVRTSDTRAELTELASALTGDMLFYLDSTRWLDATVSQENGPNRYLVTPVLRARSDVLRLEARLWDPNGCLLEVFKIGGNLSDAFDWQDRTGTDLSNRIMQSVIAAEIRKIETLPNSLRTAEQWMVYGFAFAGQSGEAHRKTLDCFAEAIRLKPGFGYAYAYALVILMSAVSMGQSHFVQTYLDKMDHWAAQVDRLEPAQSPARVMLALGRLIRTGDRKSVQADIRALIRNLPFDPHTLFWSGWLFLYMGEPETALEYLPRINVGFGGEVLANAARGGIGFAYLQMGQFERALPYLDEALRQNPDYSAAWRHKAAACGYLGRMEEAAAALDAVSKLSPDETIAQVRTRSGYLDTPGTRRYFEGLAKAGMAPG